MIGNHKHEFARPSLDIGARHIFLSHNSESTSLIQKHGGKLGLADARGVGENGFEDGSEIARQLANDTEHFEVAVCCCSDSRSSLSSRVFSMAMTAWKAKFVTNSICLAVNGRTSVR